ncbi:MAG: hypothetical protein ABW213_12095 [Tardiphaga sp.]
MPIQVAVKDQIDLTEAAQAAAQLANDAQRAIDDMLNEALMDSFPASDPVSSLQFV